MSATIATSTDGDTTSASLKIVLHGETTTCGGILRQSFSNRDLHSEQDSALSIQQGYDS
jgi:hypothetical protein